MDTLGLVDKNNLSLWNSLIKEYEIKIKKEKRNDYGVFSINNSSTIYVPINNINSVSFTHELLHIWLRKKEVYIGASIKNSINDNKLISYVFSDELVEHIGNTLDHIKMLPEYIKLGYPIELFITDYNGEKLTENEVLLLKKKFKPKGLLKKTYKKKYIDFFIGKYFAIASCPNNSFDYKKRKEQLKNIDYELFNILENFINTWIEFDIDDKNNSYHILVFDFIDELETWITAKQIN